MRDNKARSSGIKKHTTRGNCSKGKLMLICRLAHLHVQLPSIGVEVVWALKCLL